MEQDMSLWKTIVQKAAYLLELENPHGLRCIPVEWAFLTPKHGVGCSSHLRDTEMP